MDNRAKVTDAKPRITTKSSLTDNRLIKSSV